MGFTLITPSDTLPSLAQADHARYVQRIRRRYGPEVAAFASLWPGAPDLTSIGGLIDHLVAGGRNLGSALRVARQLVMERLATLDTEVVGLENLAPQLDRILAGGMRGRVLVNPSN